MESDRVEIIGKALQGVGAVGQVERIYPSAFMKISSLGIEQQRVKVIIAFDNAHLGLRPGTRLDVRIVTGTWQFLAIGDMIVSGCSALFRGLWGKAPISPTIVFFGDGMGFAMFLSHKP
jgi:hypothetical protein